MYPHNWHTYARKVVMQVVSPKVENLHDAEEVAQEALLRVVAKESKFRGDSDAAFMAWLRKFAVNSAYSWYRKKRQLDKQACRSQDYLDRREDTRERDPADRVAQQEVSDRTLDAIDTLPPRERDVCRRKLIDGAEICACGLKIAHCARCRNDLYRGKTKLQQSDLLAAYGQ